jgi:hypothetical protein
MPAGGAAAPAPHAGKTRITKAEVLFLIRACLQVGLAAFVVIGIYLLLPEDSYRSERGLIMLVTFGLLLWLIVVIVQLGQLRRSRHPLVSAAASLTFTIVLLVVIFAQVALMLAASDPAAYNITLDKTAAMYFSMTVTSTVGFGDIVPRSDLARNITSLQMFINLVFLASAVRVLVGAATSRKAMATAAASTN